MLFPLWGLLCTNAAVNPCVQVFGWTRFQFSWVYTWGGPAVCRWDRRKDSASFKGTLTHGDAPVLLAPSRGLPGTLLCFRTSEGAAYSSEDLLLWPGLLGLIPTLMG